jgi:hypothetical protein
MLETLNSMVRLSAAITVFGAQQVQTAVGSADSKESVDKLREVIDEMTAAVSSRIEEAKRPSFDNIYNLGHEVVDRTWENTTGMVKTMSGWLFGMVKGAAPVSSEPEGR